MALTFKHPHSSDKRGGGEISNLLLLKGLLPKHQPIVLCAAGHGLWGKSIDGVIYYDLSVWFKFFPERVATMISKLLYTTLASIWGAYLKPDLVFSGAYDVVSARRIGRITGAQVGIMIRAFENFKSKVSAGEKLRSLLKTWVYGDFYNGVKKLDFIVTNSEFMKQACEIEFEGVSQHVIYPPIDIALKPQSTPIGQSLRLVMVSDAPKKGYLVFEQLAVFFDNHRFTVIGASEDRIKSPEARPKNLNLLPWTDQPLTEIAKADIVLVPSQWEEPFGRIAIEALRSGKITIVSNLGGLPETVNHEEKLMCQAESLDHWKIKITEIQTEYAFYSELSSEVASSTERCTLDVQLANFHQIVLRYGKPA